MLERPDVITVTAVGFAITHRWSMICQKKNDVSSAATATFAGAWVAPCGARKHSVKAVDVVDEASFTSPVSVMMNHGKGSVSSAKLALIVMAKVSQP